MTMSQEFQIAINLIKKVREYLEELKDCQDEKEIREIIECIRPPIENAAYQFKTGQGPMKDEILEIILPIVREMREKEDFNLLKEKVAQLLNMIDSLENLQAAQQN